MKFLRNLLIATTAVAAMSATAAFADATATYTDGTVAVTGVDTSVFGDQVTVIIVPDGTTTVSEGDIYYINQDDQTGITTILAGMGMKELAEGDPSDFEVWIGGTDVSEETPIIKLDFATAIQQTIDYGNIDTTGDSATIIDVSDVLFISQTAAKLRTGATDDQIATMNVDMTGDSATVIDVSDVLAVSQVAAKLRAADTLPIK